MEKPANSSKIVSLTLQTDGGSRGNPGLAAYGFVISEKTKVLAAEGKQIGIKTNNFAEYMAVLEGIRKLVNIKDPSEVDLEVVMDSEVIKRQLAGEYKIKSQNLVALYTQIKNLEARFAKVTYLHVRREYNKHADSLVNKALDGIEN